MRHATRSLSRWALAALAALALLALPTGPVAAFVDLDGNKIDDRIEDVHHNGWNWAFVDQDPAKRMRFGVENPGNEVFAIYVGYDHKPTTLDEAALAATGVSMVWPFVSIDYIESRATWEQIQLITVLPGVTRIEAVPIDYALNHYGSRVVRSRDSRGLTKADNFALFPSVRGELGFDGTGIVIAILDTGVNDEVDDINPGYPGHESLKGKFLGGGEFWCGQAACATPINGSSNPRDHGDDVSSYHGTHVAATAMGTGGPGGYFAGVAPGARLVDCKVLSDAGASVGGSTRGLDWITANKNRLWPGLEPGSIWQGIDVANLSLGSTECAGGSGTSTGGGASSQAVNAAVNAGIVVAIATGNDGSTECISSPAAADLSIAVGSTQHARTLVRTDDFVVTSSNEGPRDDDGDADHWDEMKPNLVAPGAGIISADGDFTSDGTGYQQLGGTSMASPHVAGVAALVREANPALTPMQVRTILQNTAEHNIPTAKAAGDRGQDPYGLDANYDPSCGWGLVDAYAAVLEALNPSSGVQVVQIRPISRAALGRVDLHWVTQREYPFLGFNVHRALDVGGAPGAFTKLNALPIAPSPNGDPVIQGDDNRTPYLYEDHDPSLTVGETYWYRVDWIDLGGVARPQPPAAVEHGELARVATVFYSIAHNAVDNDLLVRVGADLDYEPETLGKADFEVLGPGESQQDSAVVILNNQIPPNTGTSTLGTIEHFWSLGFKQGDGAEPFLPPGFSRPWFLYVLDGGFVNRTGRVTSFSMFVNDSPGSASGTTYVTDHLPMPQPTVEGGAVPTLLWIPEQRPVPAQVATFRADLDGGAVRLTFALASEEPGASARVYRAQSEDFAARVPLTAEPLPLAGSELIFVDAEVEIGERYYYWVELLESGRSSIWSGPVSVVVGERPSVTLARAPYPNPVAGSATFEYAVGADVAAGGPAQVSLKLYDLKGRVVRTLAEGPQAAGVHRIEWNATDDRGARVPAGVYYLKLRAGEVTRNVRVAVVQ